MVTFLFDECWGLDHDTTPLYWIIELHFPLGKFLKVEEANFYLFMGESLLEYVLHWEKYA